MFMNLILSFLIRAFLLGIRDCTVMWVKSDFESKLFRTGRLREEREEKTVFKQHTEATPAWCIRQFEHWYQLLEPASVSNSCTWWADRHHDMERTSCATWIVWFVFIGTCLTEMRHPSAVPRPWRADLTWARLRQSEVSHPRAEKRGSVKMETC